MKRSLIGAFATLFIVLGLLVWWLSREKDTRSLLAALGSRDAPTRLQATQALIARGSSAVPGLTDALKDPNYQVRIAAATALGRIGPQAQRPIPGLLAQSHHHHESG